MKFSFHLKPLENISLPFFKGSTLRGGFGNQFKKIVCIRRELQRCFKCNMENICAYPYIFETSPPERSTKLRNIKNIPRPYVLEPPLDNKKIYSKNDNLVFKLILIGKAIDYLPYFIYTFKELGKKGLGKARGKFELEKVQISINNSEKRGNLVYDGKNDLLKQPEELLNVYRIIKIKKWKNTNMLTMNFLTPTRIRINNSLIDKPDFHHVVRSLLHRISALSYFHCKEELNIDYRGIIEKAKKVKIEKSNLSWEDIERYSTRQKTRMKMGGFTGKITYKGDLADFIPFLLLGEQIHLGKSTTFGLGKYEIEAR